MNRDKNSKRQRGFTIIEAMVTVLLLSLVMIIFYELMISTMRTTMFVESHEDLLTVGQRVVNQVQSAVLESRMIFENDHVVNSVTDTTGTDYIQLYVDSGLSPLPMTDSRLPIVDTNTGPTAILDPDTGSETWVGNELLLARHLEAVPVPYDNDSNNATPDIPFLVDRYRLEFYYLATNTARNFNGIGHYIEVYESKSEILYDYFQLSSAFSTMTAAQKAQISGELLALPAGLPTTPVNEATRLEVTGPLSEGWDPGKPPDNSFYALDSSGNFTLNASHLLTLKTASLMPEFRGGRLSGRMEYSVAPNCDTALANGHFGPFDITDKVPLFGIVTGEFSGGFEFKIVGASGSRSVWNRLVLLSQHSGYVQSQANVVITANHQY
ncbi:MAG TPA: type II secretion system protein [Acidobacteriota bacterium]|nr:type II secretion system protein [Acidobacteriota bacterium]